MPSRPYFLNPNIDKRQMQLRQSEHAITSIYEPRYMTVEGFKQFYWAAPHEIENITFELDDGREYIDLDTPKAKFLMARSRRFKR